ncbi:MAG: Type 1 glutamine amidotransferase-like domain-containing protein [Clostridiaceae bacterium]|nr:Type 1 glutamine amidotransferase-like domain-containing protein [Clostridiaceae bacterium]
MNPIKPIFLLAGGHPLDSASMVSCLSSALQACGREKPRIAYIGTANKDNLFFFTAMKTLLHEAGAGTVALIRLAKPKPDIQAAKKELGEADAVFLSGGEVEDGMSWLARHELTGYLRDLYSQGKLFIGLSAGSIMMGTHWVRWAKPDDDATAVLFDCLGLVPTIFDTHAEDEDWKELKMTLLLMGPDASGYGIPRDGMVRADDQGRLTHSGNDLHYYVNNKGHVQKAQDG